MKVKAVVKKNMMIHVSLSLSHQMMDFMDCEMLLAWILLDQLHFVKKMVGLDNNLMK